MKSTARSSNTPQPVGMAIVSLGVLGFGVLVFLLGVYRSVHLQWDDGYITFRYAQHLAHGQGLTWNVGAERVEGYTSLFDVALLALGMKLGIAPNAASVAIGVCSVLGTVALVVALLRKRFGVLAPPAAALLALYLADANTITHATSGLETQLAVLVLCATLYAAIAFLQAPSLLWASVLAWLVFIGVLTRPETVIYAAALYAALAYALWLQLRAGSELGHAYRLVLLSGALCSLLGAGYAAWKLSYFGYVLPNPFYVKSNRVGLAGLPLVSLFVTHVAVYYVPVLALVFLLGFSRAKLVLDRQARAWLMLALAPALLALAYYTTIIHEVGGSHRFSYPTSFYLLFAFSVVLSSVEWSSNVRALASAAVCAVYVLFAAWQQGELHRGRIEPDLVAVYHEQIANTLRDTGLGSKATVITEAAGVVPYVSAWNHIDPVGLTDNYLSGRTPLTIPEREAYLWGRNADVYFGYEPPASAGAERPEDDARMQSRYVQEGLVQRELRLVQARVLLKDPVLLHHRMRELRDHWVLVGEIPWTGFDSWGLKSFAYVRNASPHREQLVKALQNLATTPPNAITL